MSATNNEHPSNDGGLTNHAGLTNGQVSDVNGINTENTQDIWDVVPISDLYDIVLEIYRKGNE